MFNHVWTLPASKLVFKFITLEIIWNQSYLIVVLFSLMYYLYVGLSKISIDDCVTKYF